MAALRSGGLRRSLLLLGLALAWLPLAQGAELPVATESGVKAAYLYKLTAFVEWPPTAFETAESPLVIGVLGTDAVYAELVAVLDGRTVHGRPLQARRMTDGEAAAGLHVLYVGGHLTPTRRALLQQLRPRPVLVVTDDPDGLARGAVINFLNVDGRVRFEASLPNAERAGLRLSARMLGVAERVVAAP